MFKQFLFLGTLFYFGTVQAATNCPTSKVDELSSKCRGEIFQAIRSDGVAAAMSATLEKSLRLKVCRATGAHKLEWSYVEDDATGPYLYVTTFVGCDSDEGVDGYWVGGQYYLSDTEPSYVFMDIRVSSHE